jgi:hypothetical protein
LRPSFCSRLFCQSLTSRSWHSITGTTRPAARASQKVAGILRMPSPPRNNAFPTRNLTRTNTDARQSSPTTVDSTTATARGAMPATFPDRRRHAEIRRRRREPPARYRSTAGRASVVPGLPTERPAPTAGLLIDGRPVVPIRTEGAQAGQPKAQRAHASDALGRTARRNQHAESVRQSASWSRTFNPTHSARRTRPRNSGGTFETHPET